MHVPVLPLLPPRGTWIDSRSLWTLARQGPFSGGALSGTGAPSTLPRVRTRVGVSGRPGPCYLHVPGEVEDMVPLLRGISLPGRQQEQLVAALRIGARHRGALQTVAVLRGAPRAAARVHSSGLRAGRGVSGSEQRPQEQQHQRRGPQTPGPLHGLEPPGPRTGRRGRGLRSPTALDRRDVSAPRASGGRGERRARPAAGRLWLVDSAPAGKFERKSGSPRPERAAVWALEQ